HPAPQPWLEVGLQAAGIGLGTGLQAWIGWRLTRPAGGAPLRLERPGQIVRLLTLGGPVACLCSASVAILTLTTFGNVPTSEARHLFLNWWWGDTLGVLVGTPMVLPLVAQPAAVWQPRWRRVGLPLLITAGLLTLVLRQMLAWEEERKAAVFDQGVEATSRAVQLRLQSYEHALEALHSVFLASETVTREEFRRAAQYWLGSLEGVQAIGWEERVARARLPAFEAQQRAEGLSDYRVYDTLRKLPPSGAEVVAVRFIEPEALNRPALGLNILSRYEPRRAYEQALEHDQIVATSGIRLSQEIGQQVGIAVYRPVYQGPHDTVAERRRAVTGTIFLAARMNDLLAAMLKGRPAYLEACLFERQGPVRHLLGGDDICRAARAGPPAPRQQTVRLDFGGQQWELDIWASRPVPLAGSAGTYWMLATAGALLSAALATLLLVMTGHTRRLEQAMQDARRLAAEAKAANLAKSEFLSRMSHELRTPLNAVLGFAQVMEMDPQAPLLPTQLRRVQQIQQAGWHLLDMIDDVLDLSRLDTGNLRLDTAPQSVAEALKAVANLVEDLARQQGITLQWPMHVPPDWVVQADATRLRQILTNLLSNAIKYNRPQGTVTVSVSQVRGRQNQAQIRIAVADTGLGMSPAQMEQLFQPFNRLGRERNMPDGTGIGLVISRHLAILMGGSLMAHSEEHVGSTFTLTLPAAERSAPQPAATAPVREAVVAPQAAATASPAPAGPRHVLCVEDNAVNAELIRAALQARSGMTVTVAPRSQDALQVLHDRLHGRRPDLILLDLHLPDVSGLELLHLLKANPDTASIPVVVISADAIPEQINAAKAAGAHSFVSKPVAMPELLSLVDGLLTA
ncbi:MAG TPA: CHASE domain-containing protein, partial [Aquabacterium sp.]|nr:CHASE domain-containing protein [Aquabacterium sp.]